ncbi:hypothetical protein RRG08_016593 [Elysia crispata]|uniref:Uncharacterized protein n=1 Tax=Elysia crispata TaxID=231223 RepID=A0AAE1A0L7_9GAST|nr:hypothetical protein RRG08_016593 [Elysia crispata]
MFTLFYYKRQTYVIRASQCHCAPGSVEKLRDAILAGATARVLWARYHVPEGSTGSSSRLYALDTVQVKAHETGLVGYAYSYQATIYSPPMWTLIRVDTSGVVEEILANGTTAVTPDASLKWIVLERERTCFQPEPLSDGPLLPNPAFSVIDNRHMGMVSDVISVLQIGSTMSMISYNTNPDTLAIAYPCHAAALLDSEKTLQGISTWVPGDVDSHMPLRVQNFDFRGDQEFEMYSNLYSENQSFAFDFTVKLNRTDVFLDPCWELALTVNHGGDVLEGSVQKLLASIQSGSRLLLLLQNYTLEILLEVETVTVFNNSHVIATSKMGWTEDQGRTWQEVNLASDGSWIVNNVKTFYEGYGQFYTDKTLRPFRYTMRDGFESEGTWIEAWERVNSGLLPRAMVEVGDQQLYLELETARVASTVWSSYFLSYREPVGGGFSVYVIGMEGYFRADVGLYRSHGANLIPDSSMYDAITLFFEEQPESDA